MSKHAAKPADNPLTLKVFVNLVGPKAIPAKPPVPFPGSPDPRMRLKNFERSYREHNAGPQGADFPLVQPKQAWLDAFDSYERLVMVAHAARRQEGVGDRRQDTAPEPEPATYAGGSEFGTATETEPAPEPEPEPVAFAGGESGGGGGGSAFETVAGAQVDTIAADSPPEPLSESLGAPDPIEPPTDQ